MKKLQVLSVLFVLVTLLIPFSGCLTKGSNPGQDAARSDITKPTDTAQGQNQSGQLDIQKSQSKSDIGPKSIYTAKIKPNEADEIMIVMFHNFVNEFKPSKYYNGEYTTTFNDFRKLLQTLYDKGYRLVSLKDYLDNNMNVPAGCTPIVFTFDDATRGQFQLVEGNGTLTVDRNTAVGILEEFYKEHPDFGLAGTFYVNLGNDNTFGRTGTLEQRLRYLIDRGFEIGNHTLNHTNLKEVKTADEVQKVIGANEKKMEEIIPGYRMNTFALPFGAPAGDLVNYVEKGEYQGTGYYNRAVMLVGANPAQPPASKKFNPLKTPRVRAAGINRVNADLSWWLEQMDKYPSTRYISDGAVDVVSVPEKYAGNVDREKLNGKKLNIYK